MVATTNVMLVWSSVKIFIFAVAQDYMSTLGKSMLDESYNNYNYFIEVLS